MEGKERREEHNEKDSKEQRGSDNAGKEQGENKLPDEKDKSKSGVNDPDQQPQSDQSGPISGPVEMENVRPLPLTPHPSNRNSAEFVVDEKSKKKDEDVEEDFIILDADHPLVRRQQAALKIHLTKHLERVNLGLNEKREAEKADVSFMQDVGAEMFRIQEQLTKLQQRLEDRKKTKSQADEKHQQTQEQLGAMKARYSSVISQDRKTKTNVSQLQAELDNLNQRLIFTQEVSEELRSNLKTLQNVTHKAGTEKNQAEDQKLQQDMYVERLMKDMERATQQVAMYEAQTKAQAQESQVAKEGLSEAEMEMESLVMARKQLLQQWNGSLVGMRKRGEAFNAMQEAIRTFENQVSLLDREIEGFKKSTNEEQEHNETLTMQLNLSQMDGVTCKKLISQKQSQQEALQAQYTACIRTLQQTERTLSRLSKETTAHQTTVNDQRRQLEKESDVRLELEDKIMMHMQQKLTHHKAAKYSQRLTNKVALLKKEKIAQLWQIESEVAAAGLESSIVGQNLDSLALTQRALDEEIARYNKLVLSTEAKISSYVTLIGQKQTTITNYNKKIYQIAASTGHEDLSPLQIKTEAITAQLEELAVKIRSDQQLWMKRQGTLVGLTQEIQSNSKDMHKLQAEYTVGRQKKVRLESKVEMEQREEAELEKNSKMLKRDLMKLNTLLCKNGHLSQALEQENALMETDFLHRLKEAERESIELQMKQEKTQEEKERLLNSLVEAEQQIMLWEKKIQLLKETRSAVEKGDVRLLKAEIHRMEVRLTQLLKQQELLLRESEATVSRRDTIVLRREAMIKSCHKQTTKEKLNNAIQRLQRKILELQKNIIECEQEIGELQKSQVSLNDRLAWQKKQLGELRRASYTLDLDFLHLQDTKERNLDSLVTFQSRSKKLQGVCDGSYQVSSTSESVGTSLHNQTERVLATRSIVQRVCKDFPKHQEVLHRLSLIVAARAQSLELDLL